MRAGLRWSGVALVGVGLGFGCSSSDDGVHGASVPALAVGGESGADAGAAGAAGKSTVGQTADTAGGGMGTAGGLENLAGASGACAGEYLCPAVAYASSATITVDLPVPVAAALEAQFTACRNSECHSGLGKAKQDFSWALTQEENGDIQLKLDDSGSTPAARLTWSFYEYDGAVMAPNDHYSLTIQPVGAATATTLFDAQVDYTTAPSDPSLVSEGYCRHCSEVFMANVDARAQK